MPTCVLENCCLVPRFDSLRWNDMRASFTKCVSDDRRQLQHRRRVIENVVLTGAGQAGVRRDQAIEALGLVLSGIEISGRQRVFGAEQVVHVPQVLFFTVDRRVDKRRRRVRPGGRTGNVITPIRQFESQDIEGNRINVAAIARNLNAPQANLLTESRIIAKRRAQRLLETGQLSGPQVE